VYADVEDAVPAPCPRFDPGLDAVAVGKVVRREERGALFGAEAFRQLGEELRVTDRAVEVDQKTCDCARNERCAERPLKAPREAEGAVIAAAVTLECDARGVTLKERNIGRRHPCAAMLAGEKLAGEKEDALAHDGPENASPW
jgi:hypothetical protein